MITVQRVRDALALERVILVLSGTVFLILTSLFTWYLLLLLYLRELGANDAEVGLAYSLLAMSFSAAGLGHVITMVSWALAGTSPLALALFAITNMGLQMSIIAYQTLLTQVTPRISRGAIVGLFGTVTGVIGGLAPTVGAYLRDGFGSAAPFWIALLAGLAMAAPLQRVAISQDALQG